MIAAFAAVAEGGKAAEAIRKFRVPRKTFYRYLGWLAPGDKKDRAARCAAAAEKLETHVTKRKRT
jgi:hypothetical protein